MVKIGWLENWEKSGIFPYLGKAKNWRKNEW